MDFSNTLGPMLQDIEFEHPNHWGHWLLILDVPLLHDVVDSNGIDLPIELRLRGGQDVLAPSPDGSLYLFEWYQVGGSRRVDDSESTVLPLDAVLVEVVDEDRLLDRAALLHQRHDDLPGPCLQSNLESNLTLDERMGLNLDISGLEGKCSMHKLQSRRLLEYSMKQCTMS